MSKPEKITLPPDLGYAEALARLQAIVEDLQNGETDIDQLGDKVEEAAALLRFCRERLKGTQGRVERLFEEDSGDR